MPKKSAGILIYRFHQNSLEILLVHPGGPLWRNKDPGAWSIPKGEFFDEDPLDAAKREVREELGINIDGLFIELSPVQLKSGKSIFAWAVEGAFDPATIKSNKFTMEWPPHSGIKKSYPEVDRAEWFDPVIAREKINPGQIPLITELENKVASHD